LAKSTRCRCGVGSWMEPTQNPAVATKPRHTMLPLLVVLFLISYVLLTTLVVLQDRTIDSQRSLIHLLFKDNLHLVATKIGLHRNPAAGSNPSTASNTATSQTPSAQTPSNQVSSNQVPSNQVPATQTPSIQVPSVQVPSAQAPLTQAPTTQVPVIEAKPEASVKAGQKSRRAQKALPSRPPVEVTDPSDMRRVSISI
jgi:hypothetical protein